MPNMTGGLTKRGSLKYPSMTEPEKRCEEYLKQKGEAYQNPEGGGVEMPNVLLVYKTVVVDKQTCEVLAEQTVIGSEADRGLLDIELTKEQKEWSKKGRLAIFTSNVGSFQRYIPEVSLAEKITE